MRPLSVKPTSVDVARAAASASAAHRPPPQSPWHSPVPYLFGGLAAMLGLIAFALLVLACSYWRFSALTGDGDGDGHNGGGEDEKESRSGEKAANSGYEEKVLVIMAGEETPTFLATPAIKCVCADGKTAILEEDCGGEEMGNGEKAEEHEETSH